MKPRTRCVLHGSFRKHFAEIKRTKALRDLPLEPNARHTVEQYLTA